MANTEKILGAIKLANEAAIDGRPWGDFLGCMNELVGGVFANLEIIDLTSGRYVELQSSEHIDINEDYLDYYQARNPRIDKLLMTRQSPIVHDHQAFSEADIDRSEFYTDFLAPHGLRYFAGIAACHTQNLFAGFSIQRSASQGNIGTQELEHLEALLPHLRTALQTYMKLGELQRQFDALRATSLAGDQPVVALDRHGVVMYSNMQADAVILQNPALLRGDRLYLGDDVNQQALVSALSEIVRQDAHAASTPHSFIVGGIHEMAAPIKGKLAAIQNGQLADYPSDTVAIFTFDPKPVDSGLPRNALQRTYALSHAELELLEALSSGVPLREAAEFRGVRYDTVRKQLRSIMSKMGVNRQSELQRLLAWLKT